MTHGTKILEGLRAMMKSLGRKPSDVESVAMIDTYLGENAIKLKRVKKAGTPKLRARDAIFDALALIDGQETAQMTRHGASRVAGAKKQILEVMDGATTEQVVAEIDLRAARYRRKHPTRELTAMALVTWWAELGGGPKTAAAALNIYVEPADWRRVGAIVLKVDPAILKDKEWADLSPEYRKAILQDMAKNAPPQ